MPEPVWRHRTAIADFDPDLADTVVGLYLVRAQIAPLNKARAGVREQLRRAVSNKKNATFALGGDAYRISVRVSPPKAPRRTVPAKVIQAYSPSLWNEAKVLKQRISVTPGLSAPEPPPVRVPTFPSAEKPNAGFTLAQLHNDNKTWSRLTALRTQENDLKTELLAHAARIGWDGQLVVFADDWATQTIQPTYDAARLAEIAPDVFDKLAVVIEPEPVERLYISYADDGDTTDGQITGG
jgi:hypothetical protein